jgi:sigma-B regulation protein RsbU (phosphoserine phosphatase)
MSNELFAGSAILIKALAAAAVFFSSYFLDLGLEKGKRMPIAIAALLLIFRDISFFFPSLPIALAFDCAASIMLAYALLGASEGRVFFATGAALASLSALAGIAVGVFPSIAESVPVFIGRLSSLLVALPLALRLFLSKPDSYRIRLFLATAYLLFYGLSIAIAGYASPYAQWIAMPLVFLPFYVVAWFELRATRQFLAGEYDKLTDTLDSVYRFVRQTDSAIRKAKDVNDLLQKFNQSMIDEIRADGGVILLVDEFDDVIEVKSYAGKYAPPFKIPEDIPRKPNRVELFMKHARVNLGEGILGDVAKNGKQVFIPDTREDPRVERNGNDDFLTVASIICLPLFSNERIIGVISMARKSYDDLFTEEDFSRCRLLADFGSLAISALYNFIESSEKKNIDHEISIAADIQKTLIPKKLPELPSASFGSFSIPARGICSDYFDVILARKNLVSIVMGDVAGKGVPASLVMVMIRAILHLVANSNKDAATIMSWVNRGISGSVDMDHFATVSYLAYDTDAGVIDFSTANHQPLLVFRAQTKQIEDFTIKSLPIGVEKKAEYSRLSIPVSSGDIVIMYTDGVLEAMNPNGQQYGRARLSNIISKNASSPAKEIAAKVKSDLQAFIGNARQHDDQSLLVMKVK